MVGLHYLKALYDESDESVVTKWVKNPYWQYFRGEETFQHEPIFLPCLSQRPQAMVFIFKQDRYAGDDWVRHPGLWI